MTAVGVPKLRPAATAVTPVSAARNSATEVVTTHVGAPCGGARDGAPLCRFTQWNPWSRETPNTGSPYPCQTRVHLESTAMTITGGFSAYHISLDVSGLVLGVIHGVP